MHPQNDVLALMSVSDPSEGLHVQALVRRERPGQLVRGDRAVGDPRCVRRGRARRLHDREGTIDRLYKWETEPIDVSDLAPGTYTFVAMTDDPSGGEGPGPFTDTRTIIVE